MRCVAVRDETRFDSILAPGTAARLLKLAQEPKVATKYAKCTIMIIIPPASLQELIDVTSTCTGQADLRYEVGLECQKHAFYPESSSSFRTGEM